MKSMYKGKSLIHVQNVFLINQIPIYIKKEDSKYVIGYEPKKHTLHFLVYKIDKSLINNVKFNEENKVKISNYVDINAKIYFRDNVEQNTSLWGLNTKSVNVRIITTRYTNLQQLYGIIYQFNWRKTGAGGRDLLELTIPECPVITNSTTISSICYKLISKQISAGGSHGLETYLIVTPSRGEYTIGNHINISNINNTGHRNMHVYPVKISL